MGYNSQTARNLHISRRIVNDWLKNFYAQGLEGLKEKPRSGRPSRLNEAQLSQLSEYIRKNSIKESGGSLTRKCLLIMLLKSLSSTIAFQMFIDCFIS